MSILVDRNTKVLVQGLTGGYGTQHTEFSLAYAHTQMVGGTHPKKGGQTWTGRLPDGTTRDLPIFASVAEGKAATGADASVVYVPPAGAADFFAGIGIPWARTPGDRRRGDGTACCG